MLKSIFNIFFFPELVSLHLVSLWSLHMQYLWEYMYPRLRVTDRSTLRWLIHLLCCVADREVVDKYRLTDL